MNVFVNVVVRELQKVLNRFVEWVVLVLKVKNLKMRLRMVYVGVLGECGIFVLWRVNENLLLLWKEIFGVQLKVRIGKIIVNIVIVIQVVGIVLKWGNV